MAPGASGDEPDHAGREQLRAVSSTWRVTVSRGQADETLSATARAPMSRTSVGESGWTGTSVPRYSDAAPGGGRGQRGHLQAERVRLARQRREDDERARGPRRRTAGAGRAAGRPPFRQEVLVPDLQRARRASRRRRAAPAGATRRGEERRRRQARPVGLQPARQRVGVEARARRRGRLRPDRRAALRADGGAGGVRSRRGAAARDECRRRWPARPRDARWPQRDGVGDRGAAGGRATPGTADGPRVCARGPGSRSGPPTCEASRRGCRSRATARQSRGGPPLRPSARGLCVSSRAAGACGVGHVWPRQSGSRCGRADRSGCAPHAQRDASPRAADRRRSTARRRRQRWRPARVAT